MLHKSRIMYSERVNMAKKGYCHNDCQIVDFPAYYIASWLINE